jgi:hypothetical protein
MKFMMMVKSAERNGPPPQALMDAMVKLTEEAYKAGNVIGMGGLAPSSQGTRVRLSGGKISVLDGPFTEAKEVIGGFAQFEFSTKEAAVKSAVEFMEVHKKYWPEWEGVTEVREIVGNPEAAAHK